VRGELRQFVNQLIPHMVQNRPEQPQRSSLGRQSSGKFVYHSWVV
jgi:hypothetical protein